MENLKVTVGDFKEYLSKFDEDQALSFVVVDLEKRLTFKGETTFLKEKPTVFFSINEAKNLDIEEREMDD